MCWWLELAKVVKSRPMRRWIRHWAQVLRLSLPPPQLTGKAGQAAQTVAKVGDALVRVVFLGVADRSVGALRRAGGELGRQIRPGEVAVTDVVAGLAADQVAAFAEGILLGSYRYSEKSGERQATSGTQVRLLAGRASGGCERRDRPGRDRGRRGGTGQGLDQHAVPAQEPAVAGGRGDFGGRRTPGSR